MINKNLEDNYYPFLLKPAGIEKLWGGRRLNDDFSKNIPIVNLAETWECSTHEDGTSIVASGIFCGKKLSDVLEEYPEFLGEHWVLFGKLPILVKFIDANSDLSIQVHPNDEYAFRNENGQLGKTEMWYILDAYEDSKIYYGLSHDITKDLLRSSILNNTITNYLQKCIVKKNDTFFIKPGKIHAIGKGILLAEIQQNSNLTYRLYDYNRFDKNGNKRELQIEKAELKKSNEPVQLMKIMRYIPGSASELLCRCKYFQVERLLINTESVRKLFVLQTTILSFEVMLCVAGCAVMIFDNNVITIFKGDCIFIPANSVKISLHGIAEFLHIIC